MKNRSLAYYRAQQDRAIRKKLKILRDVRYFNDEEGFEDFVRNPVAVGGLGKGKVHCSCNMCAEKTRKDGWKHSDKRRMWDGRENM